MSPRNFRGRSVQRGGGRAPTGWAGFLGFDATVAAGTKQIIGSFVPLPGFSHETAVRVVGDWTSQGAVGGSVVIGMCVVTDAAFAIGATAIPDPATEISDDIWMFISSISKVGVDDIQPSRLFDSRAMRKVDEGSRLVLMIANTGSTSIGFSIYIRMLGKLAVRS